MKLSLIALTSVLALAAAQDSNSTETETSTSSAPETTPTLSPVEQCVVGCGNDTVCQAECVGVPAPNDQQANDTTACAAECDQGDGSEADTNAYAQCQAACISSTFFPGSQTSAPTSTSSLSSDSDSSATPTSSADDSSNTDDSNSDDSSNDSNSDDSNSDDPTSTESDSPSATGEEDPTETNAAMKLGTSAAGLTGFLIAAWVL